MTCTVELALAATASAPGTGRKFARHNLERWGLAHMIGDTQLVMSELITNAAQAAGPAIQVKLGISDKCILIEVWDCNPWPPVQQELSDDSVNGRGLYIVGALCERWDYYHPRRGGKCVWAELAIQPDGLASAELPRRIPGSPGVLESMTDPGLLRRVHDRLKNL
jgi:anti-sigma regulatory factor (Ser/Thr protein kinase)